MKKYITQILFLTLLFGIVIGCDSQKKEVTIDVSELGITEIQQAYKNGDFTSEQLVKAYLKQIESLNGKLNAITSLNPEAIAIAQKLDAEYKKTGVMRPLHGIPLLVKDNINTKGLATTGGSLALQNFIPKEDAFIIKKLVAAGAIIIAKTNMAEWAFSAKHTESSTFGTTHNPYNLDYVPAGSSGGTATGVASNFGTIGLGTDTGNSIRGPSAHNALVGFRTTIGLISREGIIPLILRNDVVGPMCKTVEDATKVMEVMIGYDVKDPVTKNSEGKIPENYTQFLQKDGLKGARIGVLRELSNDNPDPEVLALFEKSLVDMQNLGAEIIDTIAIPNFATHRESQWCVEFREDVEAYLATYVKNDTIQTIEDIVRIGTKSAYAKRQLGFFGSNSGRMGNPEIVCEDLYKDIKRVAFRKAIEKRMDEFELDAIVYPTWNNKPARIVVFEEEYKGDNSQIIAPHTGQPAFTVPMGFTEGNLPAGLQFLGRMYDEPTLIKLVYSYEQGTKHRVPPKLNNEIE